MRDEYDFAHGERGKFHREGARLHVPVYLEADVLEYYSKLAADRGITPEELVNGHLRQMMAKDVSSE